MAHAVRVTTDPGYYAEHSESVELWSPGNPLFRPPEFTVGEERGFPDGTTLADVLGERA